MVVIADQGDRAAKAAAAMIRDVTLIHPVTVALLALLCLWAMAGSRRLALMPLVILMCFVPSAQRIAVFGADFTLLRILGMTLAARVVLKREYEGLRWNRADKALLAWAIIGGMLNILQRGTLDSAVYVSGTLFDSLMPYYATRCLVRSWGDITLLFRALATVAIISAGLFVLESLTRRNLFGLLGGVAEITMVRDGRLRCQGPYSHPILAGVFWACLIPGLVGSWLALQRWSAGSLLALSGAGSALVIVLTTASSTPVFAALAGILFWVAWPARRLTSIVLWSIPVIGVVLHLSMEAPIWHLVARVSAVGGSTSYHRFVIIDESIRHFDEWWMLGTPSTAHWNEYFQTWDITNQFVLEGVRGGVVRLGLFLLLVTFATGELARAFREAGRLEEQLMCWGIAGVIAVSLISFVGVSYFGQIEYLWITLLAVCAGARGWASSRCRKMPCARVPDRLSIGELA